MSLSSRHMAHPIILSSYSLKNNSRTYFYTSFLAYIFGLGLTIFVMHTFKHAQVRIGEAKSVSGEKTHAKHY